ncbi:dual specificity phosphatase [Strigomonas culicis]|uniref:Dual specificity phosphatase n=1 Tax=Strigomonas culicis TaxID=28005 RepID=S9ULZ7_9TRYP|nr:dual specificity phosphatase [Strigomonas culicis]|eukprot:EPY31867.1 dual specificity phosphatase [Strigomonas culicis]
MIKQQLMDRQKQLGMVAACLEMDEIKGYGLDMLEFATEDSWRRFVNPEIVYAHLPMTDTTANIPFYKVAMAVQDMHACINARKQVVYVHCKAGKGRSWMVTMCYLVTYGGMSYKRASELLRSKRGQVSPSSSQEKFVSDFPLNFAKWSSLKEYNSTQ